MSVQLSPNHPPGQVPHVSTHLFPKKWLHRTAVLIIVAVILVISGSAASSSSLLVPTISIQSVAADSTVTVTAVNFPKDQTFTVRMGEMGSLGVNGTVVGTTATGNSTAFTATYDVPAELNGRYQIAIRLDSPQGYYSYNWFYNNTTHHVPTPSIGYTGIPTFSITSVEMDKTVTIQTNNYPPNQEFTVTMGPMFTRGIGGIFVTTFNSEGGGSFSKTFEIPAALAGSDRISIRAQTAHAYPYYSFNWFYNNDAGNTAGNGGETPVPNPMPTNNYSGIPTIKVCTVERDKRVTVLTNNFPANQTFTVTMGPMFTRGIGGIVVGTFDSGDGGGNVNATFDIPAHLAGSYRISIRLQTGHAYPYYAYNWFYNNTAAVC